MQCIAVVTVRGGVSLSDRAFPLTISDTQVVSGQRLIVYQTSPPGKPHLRGSLGRGVLIESATGGTVVQLFRLVYNQVPSGKLLHNQLLSSQDRRWLCKTCIYIGNYISPEPF